MTTSGRPKLAVGRRPATPTHAVVLDARVLRGSGGGPDKTILNSPRFLKDVGYRMLCAYLRDPNDPGFETLRRKAEERDAPLIAVDDNGPLDAGVVPRLLNVCRRERVSIWHGHDYKTNALGLLLRRFWRMRLVTTVHGWVHHTARTPLYYHLDRLCLPFYEKVICVSEDLYSLSRDAGVPVDRCELLENGIDGEEYRRRRSTDEAKRRMGLRRIACSSAPSAGSPRKRASTCSSAPSIRCSGAAWTSIWSSSAKATSVRV